MNACTDSANGDNGRTGSEVVTLAACSDHFNPARGRTWLTAILQGVCLPVKITPCLPAGTSPKE